MVPNILAFARKYNLKLTDSELRNDKNCHETGQGRPHLRELKGKEANWLKEPEDSLYAAHLKELTKDAPKLVMLKQLIDQLGEDCYETAEGEGKGKQKEETSQGP